MGSAEQKGLRALTGKNGPFRKWFISSYDVAYVKISSIKHDSFKFQKYSRSNIYLCVLNERPSLQVRDVNHD